MTDKDHVNKSLDEFFAAARDTPPKPSADLVTRILADAQSVQLARVRSTSAPPRKLQRSTLWAAVSEFLWFIGGLRALLALSTAAVAGIWIGISPPDKMAEQVQSYLQGDGYNATDSLWSVDVLGGFIISTTEG